MEYGLFEFRSRNNYRIETLNTIIWLTLYYFFIAIMLNMHTSWQLSISENWSNISSKQMIIMITDVVLLLSEYNSDFGAIIYEVLLSTGYHLTFHKLCCAQIQLLLLRFRCTILDKKVV